MPCSVAHWVHQYFEGTYCFHLPGSRESHANKLACLILSPKMEGACSSETMVNFYHTTWYIPEGGTLCSHCRWTVKSHTFLLNSRMPLPDCIVYCLTIPSLPWNPHTSYLSAITALLSSSVTMTGNSRRSLYSNPSEFIWIVESRDEDTTNSCFIWGESFLHSPVSKLLIVHFLQENRYTKSTVVWYSSIWNFHQTGKNFLQNLLFLNRDSKTDL
jgi:hypothetical protein